MTTDIETTFPAYDTDQCPAWCTDEHDPTRHPQDQFHSRDLAETDAGVVRLVEDVDGVRTVYVEMSWWRELVDPTPDQLRQLVRAQQATCDEAADALERLGLS